MIKNEHIVIKNIYYMLSYAYKTLQQQDEVNVEGEYFENIYDLFAAILAKGIANQVKKGLNKEYIENTSELSTLRGKIDFTNSIRKQTMRSRHLVCTYDEFSENSYMNRILKSVAYSLIAAEGVKRNNKDALKKVILSFSEVQRIELSSINWGSLRYHRNNATYQMLMNVCFLTVQKLLMTTEPGTIKINPFLDEQQMHRLYEKFILEYYKKHFPEYKPASRQIQWDVEGIIDFLPVMQSDIMLTYEEKLLIIDAKFYSKVLQKQYDKQTLHSNNLYQIFTYVKNQDKYNSGKVSGMLLYAKTDEGILPDIEYQMGKNSIGIMTLDLGTEFTQIADRLDSIILKYFNSEREV
jgi:5-methylcytosine-specific restriction enzyme subunit McrC